MTTQNSEIEKQSESEVSGQLVGIHQSWQAPLPPPKFFQQYEEILPGLSDRITVMAEKNAKHRRHMEKGMLYGGITSRIMGLLFAFIIVMSGMAAGVYLILKDKPISGFFSSVIPLGTVAGAFIYERKQHEKKDEKEEDRDE